MDVKKQKIDILTECIVKAIEGSDFKWEIFFRYWFRIYGNPLFFLFKKNLSVTNTQYVELFSLLTNYSYQDDKLTNKKLLFYSTEHIKTTFTELITTIIEDYKPEDNSTLIQFSEKYIDIFESTVAIDMFFGSCAVFLPYGIYSDLDKIVHDSGYIHSAGRSVFIRNIKKSKKNAFLESIDSYLKNRKDQQEIPFIVYSHEDFSDFDKEFKEQIERGIDQCKIYIDKMNMGSYKLSTIITRMQQSDEYKNKLFIPDPGNYHEKHSFKGNRTLWLITDRSISGGQLKNPGLNRYYICYEQTLKNDSPLFYFDENKPAWKSHTTLPHSLTASLLNISRPFLNHGKICDPFCGAGTTWFEVKRLKLKNEIKCSDLSVATKLLLSDNLLFFTKTAKELDEFLNELNYCYSEKSIPGQYKVNFATRINKELDPYSQARMLIESLKNEQKGEDQEFTLSESFVEDLGKLSFLNRIVFYVALRAELRFQSGFTRKSITYEKAFDKSLDKLIEQINMYVDLRKETEYTINEDKLNVSKINFIKSKATYSIKLIPSFIFNNFDFFKESIRSEIFSLDARDLDKNANDLIICDPPYGFNTNEDSFKLVELYTEFIDKAIDSIKPFGQLIICLPAESYTGRDLPYCTRSDLVSRQIIIKAHQKGRLIYRPAQSLPLPLLNPPYYWESEKALRRVILHFCIY